MCKWCNKVLAEHATHFKDHLKTCTTYVEQTMLKTIQKSNPFNVPVETHSNQSRINFASLTVQKKEDLDMLAATWCFLSNHPFNMFENTTGKMFVQSLNPAYKAPTRKTI